MPSARFSNLAAVPLTLITFGKSEALAQSTGAANQDAERMSAVQRARDAAPTGPEAITDISGKFRVDGKIRKRCAGITSCTCNVTFTHSNNGGGDDYTQGSKTITGNSCKMNVPFRFAKGDSGRPVVVSMNARLCGLLGFR